MTTFFEYLSDSFLEDDRFPFERAIYHASMNPSIDCNFIGFSHELTNAPFLQNLIESGRASFGCILYTKNTLCKRLYLSRTPLHVIPWSVDDVGQNPQFQAIIVATKEFRYKFSRKDGVSKRLLGKSVAVPRGARLAFGVPGKPIQTRFDPLSRKLKDTLLKYRLDEGIQDGGFYVSVESGRAGRVEVFMAADLYNFMENESTDDQLHRSVLAHILTSVFWVFRDGIRNDDNDDFAKKHQGVADLLTEITGESFIHQIVLANFQPDKVATSLAPLVVGQAEATRSNEFLEFNARKIEALRLSLIEKRGSDAQRVLLEACLGRESFFSWVELNLNGGEVGQVVPEVFSRKLDEDEFTGMDEPTEREASQLWSDVPSTVACRSSFWGIVTVNHIEKGIIEPSYLAFVKPSSKLRLKRTSTTSVKSIAGVERITKALGSNDDKKIDRVARTILRKLSGLQEARGIRSVSCDCPFGRAWWRQRILHETVSLTMGNQGAIRDTLYNTKTYWEKLVMLPQMEVSRAKPSRFGDSKVRTAFIWALSEYVDNFDYEMLFDSGGLIDDCMRSFINMSLKREFGVFEMEELKHIIKEEVIQPEHRAYLKTRRN